MANIDLVNPDDENVKMAFGREGGASLAGFTVSLLFDAILDNHRFVGRSSLRPLGAGSDADPIKYLVISPIGI